MEFGGVMHSAMEQIAIKSDCACSIFVFSDVGRPRVLSLSQRLSNIWKYFLITYHQTSDITHTKSQKVNISHLF